jgi:ribosome recycling factor
MSNKIEETKALEEDIQNKYFERLEKITKEYCKTLRTFFITQSIFIAIWIIGYFMVAFLK